MNVSIGTKTNFNINIPAADIAKSITADEVVNSFKRACDVQKINYQPMSEAEVSEAVSILKGYFELFSENYTFTFFSKIVFVDGKMSFDINFQSVLEKILTVNEWESCHGRDRGRCFTIRDNKIIMIYYQTDKNGKEYYDDILISSDETKVALFKIVHKLLYGRE